MKKNHDGFATLAVLVLVGFFAASFMKPLWGGEPKTVYLPIAGVSEADSVRFSCYLKRGGAESETRTDRDAGFAHLTSPDGSVCHLSIQCGNFQVMQWSPGDRLVIEMPGRKPVIVRLDASGEQYGPETFLK